jgi:putative oxidoreductase
MADDREGFLGSVGLLALRVGVGGFMATHGWGKVQMVFAGEFDKFGDPIGLGGALSLVLVAGAEFACALMVVAGLYTRVAAIPPAIAMAVAAFVAHASDPWTMGEGYRRFMAKEAESWSSKEPALLFLVPFLALALTGAGRFSVDAWLRGRRERRQAAAAAEAGKKG